MTSSLNAWIVPGITFISTFLDSFVDIGLPFLENSAVLIKPFCAFVGGGLGYAVYALGVGTSGIDWGKLFTTAGYAAAGALIAELIMNYIFNSPNGLIVAMAAASFANYGYIGTWFPGSS